MLKVLISAYACSPEWGSEVGMGWNWVCQLARHCELHVITESGFRAAIEAAGTAPFESGSQPVFHYLDIGESGRKNSGGRGTGDFTSITDGGSDRLHNWRRRCCMTSILTLSIN